MASHADYASGNQQPVCQNCTTSTTPLWRRDEYGSVLCNACGLFLKLHGTSRPISLKTDVIKSRNRVRTAIPGQKRKVCDLASRCPSDRPLTLYLHSYQTIPMANPKEKMSHLQHPKRKCVDLQPDPQILLIPLSHAPLLLQHTPTSHRNTCSTAHP